MHGYSCIQRKMHMQLNMQLSAAFPFLILVVVIGCAVCFSRSFFSLFSRSVEFDCIFCHTRYSFEIWSGLILLAISRNCNLSSNEKLWDFFYFFGLERKTDRKRTQNQLSNNRKISNSYILLTDASECIQNANRNYYKPFCCLFNPNSI